MGQVCALIWFAHLEGFRGLEERQEPPEQHGIRRSKVKNGNGHPFLTSGVLDLEFKGVSQYLRCKVAMSWRPQYDTSAFSRAQLYSPKGTSRRKQKVDQNNGLRSKFKKLFVVLSVFVSLVWLHVTSVVFLACVVLLALPDDLCFDCCACR